MNVQIVLFDGFDLLDAIAPYEVFDAAARYSEEEITVTLVSAEGKRRVPSGINQVQLEASGGIDLSAKGILLVPGAAGSVDDRAPDSIVARIKQAAESELSPALKEAYQDPDILLSTVCGGSLVLAMNGLLEGRHAVTHHLGMGLLQASDAFAVQARVVDDGDLVTGGGVTSGLDVALYLVERELGPRIAHAVEQMFEYERRGTVWKAEGRAPKESIAEKPTEETSSHLPVQTDKNVDFEGKWETNIATPIGDLSVLLDLSSVDGRITGTAKQGEDVIALDPIVQEGNQLNWSMKVKKPIRLSLKFNVAIDGNQMYGEAKAGMLPSSKLTGHRIL